MWGLTLASSSDPCSQNFRGTAADSEEETKTIQFAIDVTQRLQHAYINIKAATATAGSIIAFPFSFSK